MNSPRRQRASTLLAAASKAFVAAVVALSVSCSSAADPVDGLVRQADDLADSNASRVRIDEFDFFSLTTDELAELYLHLRANRETHKLYSKLAFEVRDEIIRRHVDAQMISASYAALPEFGFLALLSQEGTSFDALTCDLCTPEEFTSKAEIRRARVGAEPTSKLLVLHAALEAPNARVGGIAEFLSGLLKAEAAAGERLPHVEGRLVTPFYDFLKIDQLDGVKFIGLVSHYVDGYPYGSSIYELDTGLYRQYLVQPDPAYRSHASAPESRGWEIFDVRQPSALYAVVSNDAGWIYFASAVAAIGALYHGPSGAEDVSVVQLNGRNLAFASPAMADWMNHKRRQVGLQPIGVLATVHDTSNASIEAEAVAFTRIGMKQPPVERVNLNAVASAYAHVSNIVSQAMVEEVMKDGIWSDPSIARLFRSLSEQTRFVGITNGIFTDDFDITKAEVLGSLSVAADYSNLAEQKQAAKRLLFEEGLIGSPSDPLFLFVGRYSAEKGIDVLANFANHIVRAQYGQVVTMGVVTGNVPGELLDLRRLEAAASSHGLIRVYTDYQHDQLGILPSVNAAIGKVIRFASDFTIVPSASEAAGLVPVEGLSMASGTISSYLQGLKDQCPRPYGLPDQKGNVADIFTFTCLPFARTEDFSKTISNLLSQTDTMVNAWGALTPEQKTAVQLSWARTAKDFDWLKPGGAVDQYRALYEETHRRAAVVSDDARTKLIESFAFPID